MTQDAGRGGARMQEAQDLSTAETDALVRVSSALASGDRARLERALDTAFGACGPVAVEEVLLQSYLFLGYPAALRGLAVWRQVSGVAAPDAVRDDPADWPARGEMTCSTVYAGQYARLRDNIARLHPDMEQWMVTEGYGKVLGRPGLPLPVRELCVVALLAWQDAAPQLYSHLRGALNVGVPLTRLAETVVMLKEDLPHERQVVLEEQWELVRRRRTA